MNLDEVVYALNSALQRYEKDDDAYILYEACRMLLAEITGENYNPPVIINCFAGNVYAGCGVNVEDMTADELWRRIRPGRQSYVSDIDIIDHVAFFHGPEIDVKNLYSDYVWTEAVPMAEIEDYFSELFKKKSAKSKRLSMFNRAFDIVP